MAKLRTGDLCPRCREGKVHRAHRRNWMRWLPASKYYKCDGCRVRFLAVCGWAIRLPDAQEKPAAEN